MQSSRLQPKFQYGGGVPQGGTEHAGHAYWESTTTPFVASSSYPSPPPQPSLYAKPIILNLPSVVTKPYGVLKPQKESLKGMLKNLLQQQSIVGGASENPPTKPLPPNMPIEIPPTTGDSEIPSQMPDMILDSPPTEYSPSVETLNPQRLIENNSGGLTRGNLGDYFNPQASQTDITNDYGLVQQVTHSIGVVTPGYYQPANVMITPITLNTSQQTMNVDLVPVTQDIVYAIGLDQQGSQNQLPAISQPLMIEDMAMEDVSTIAHTLAIEQPTFSQALTREIQDTIMTNANSPNTKTTDIEMMKSPRTINAEKNRTFLLPFIGADIANKLSIRQLISFDAQTVIDIIEKDGVDAAARYVKNKMNGKHAPVVPVKPSIPNLPDVYAQQPVIIRNVPPHVTPELIQAELARFEADELDEGLSTFALSRPPIFKPPTKDGRRPGQTSYSKRRRLNPPQPTIEDSRQLAIEPRRQLAIGPPTRETRMQRRR
jgi:hypothetical protein